MVEFESQESLGLRINNVIFNPTKVSTTTGEYSYSFKIPSTPKNDKILNYANNLSKTNKFHVRYPSQVFADGNLIFDGSLTIKKYDAKDKIYECNLVNIKISTLEDIFGDDKLTDMSWYVPFKGADTINSVNADASTKYWFPFVCYGAFSKNPMSSTQEIEYADYTSKYDIDGTNVFYLEDFYPSLQLVEQMRKCFESKGYTVGGNVFNNSTFSNIYCSTQLAEGQDPEYNVGNPKFGKLDVKIQMQALPDYTIPKWQHVQDLEYKYFPAGYEYDSSEMCMKPNAYNFDEIITLNLLRGVYYYNNPNNMIKGDGVHDEYYIEIPADGFYRISMSGSCTLDQDNGFTARQKGLKESGAAFSSDSPIVAMGEGAEDYDVWIPVDATRTMPFEIQLVKGLDPNIELIKGKYNLEMLHPDISQGAVLEAENWWNPILHANLKNTVNCYPHEPFGSAWEPPANASEAWVKPSIMNYEKIADWKSTRANTTNGYFYSDDSIMCYDPVVSDAFICGWTTMGNDNGYGITAFIKNGWSWSKTYTEKNYALYKQKGYYKNNDGLISSQPTDVNYNELPDAPEGYYEIGGGGYRDVTACVYGMVKLNKGDILTPQLIKRAYRDGNGNLVTYAVKVNDLRLTIEAITPKSYAEVKKQNYGWNTPTDFPTELNLFNFTSKEKKVSEWLKNVQDAFNLSFEMNGNNVDINLNQGIKKDIMTAVDIDDRVNSNEVESEIISYPKTMSVQYKTDTDEHGFYTSVPSEYIDRDDWKKFGDSGFTIIQLSDDSYETQSQNKSLQFSYCWYDNFNFKMNLFNKEIRIPVIEKEEYMIDKINDQGAMAHRGYQLAQRFWFRTFSALTQDNDKLWVSITNNPTNGSSTNYWAYLYAPTNQMDGFNLSNKDTEKSIVTEWFNIYPMLSSNYVTLETFLNPIEYLQIKGGCLVHFDDDLYYTSEISGYDPTGTNPTKLKLIKKT